MVAGYKESTMYEERSYRNTIKDDGLYRYQVIVKETDLFVRTDSDLKSEVENSIIKYRHQLESYIKDHADFLKSLKPITVDSLAPKIVKEMADAARMANVGPMAAVAGAISEFVGRGLEAKTENIIIENGGDIYLKTMVERNISIYAGKSVLSHKVGIRIRPESSPLGICTSSGTVGHSLSFGKADAVCVLSKSTLVADAAATSTCNVVKGEEDIKKGLDYAMSIKGVDGVLIIVGDKLGAFGEVELVRV
jgi:ApbE superfamily uncharacterized protein (UPF0280 family)